MHPTNLEELEGEFEDAVIARFIAGSRAYGTQLPTSDEDVRGVFAVPGVDYLSIEPPPPQVADARNDIVYYSLRRFLELVAAGNPNLLELLFMPADCTRKISAAFEMVVRARERFVTKLAYTSHVGYARAQIKRARGTNKWVNNPQPEEPPERDQFCWILPLPEPAVRQSGVMPLRPVPLADSGIDLTRCHVASLERMENAYRLYDFGDQARGVFRGGAIHCESIPRDEEWERCVGLLLFGETAYQRACRDHKNYWTWRRMRNEDRWKTQERGETDYDAKNMMHTFRLLHSGGSLLRTGEPIVRFDGEPLDFLRSIREGRFTYDELIRRAESTVEQLDRELEASSLPDQPDPSFVEELLRSATREWESHRGG